MEQLTIKLYKTEVKATVVFNVTLFNKTFRLAKGDNGVMYASYMAENETRYGTPSFSVANRREVMDFFKEIAQDNSEHTKEVRAISSYVLTNHLPL